MTHCLPDADQTTTPVQERAITGLVAALHSVFVWFALFLFVSWSADSTIILWFSQLHSPGHGLWMRLTSALKLLTPILILVSSILGIVGFIKFDSNRRINHAIRIYIATQLVIGLLILGPEVLHLFESVIRGNLKEPAIRLALVTAGYLLLTMPMMFFICHRVWAQIKRLEIPVDRAGRYLFCKRCGYDLRGTPGPTCPECGASVMAQGENKASTSTAAD